MTLWGIYTKLINSSLSAKLTYKLIINHVNLRYMVGLVKQNVSKYGCDNTHYMQGVCEFECDLP